VSYLLSNPNELKDLPYKGKDDYFKKKFEEYKELYVTSGDISLTNHILSFLREENMPLREGIRITCCFF
jgi:hypothetical protein